MLLMKLVSTDKIKSFCFKCTFVLVLTMLCFHFFAGKSALHWAAAVNNVEATVALLKNGANKDMQDLKVCNRVI